MSHVRDDDPAVVHDDHIHGRLEFARSLPSATKLAHEISIGSDNNDPRRQAIEQVEVPGIVEPHPADRAELLPRFSERGADATDLLEIGLQPAVFSREFDHLLGSRDPGRRRDRHRRQERRGDSGRS